jgi:hypothetical protein
VAFFWFDIDLEIDYNIDKRKLGADQCVYAQFLRDHSFFTAELAFIELGGFFLLTK